MAAPATPTVIRSKPGIKRDGTRFEGDFYVDGLWTRFQRGLPRKMGGYRAINAYLSEISRGFNIYAKRPFQYCHSGGAEKLERFTIDSSFNTSAINDRTPVSLLPSTLNRWMFANSFDSSTVDNQLLAHVAPNSGDITNDAGGQIFAGDLTATTPLVDVPLPPGANATGGIVMLHPYLFYYGSDGIVGWSKAGEPTDLTSTPAIARPWGQKFIKGMPLRAGSGQSPSGILWAFDAVVRGYFTGGTTEFAFDVVATDTSIMSADSVVEYDGVFYWAGVDRFLMFNGVVREVPNELNFNWFYDGLNYAQRAKVFAFKVPRFGEIWWCYPRGDAVECTHAVIYNVRENTWYDTILPSTGRAAGQFSNGLSAPILLDWTNSPTGYKAWAQERGSNMIDGVQISPVRAYYETADISQVPQGVNDGLGVSVIEPDFVQSGDMSVQVTGRANARSNEVSNSPTSFPAEATGPENQTVTVKAQRRELRFRFESNAIDGNFEAGQTIAHIQPADGRRVS